MNDERLQILRMVEQGKVSADEAAKLLEAVGSDKTSPTGTGRRRNRFIRIKVLDGDKTRVNVNFPLELARVALRFVPKDALESRGIGDMLDVDEIVRQLEEGFEGKLVDVEDGATRVEVIVE